MPRTELRTSSGVLKSIDQGESCIVTATMTDTTGADLSTASVLTLTATLLNASNGAVINSRNAQDILNTNGGVLADNGDGSATLTLSLLPADNPNVAAAVGSLEEHYLLITWTWQDESAVTQTGKKEWSIFVRPLTTPVT